MMKRLVVSVIAFLGACAPISVYRVQPADFQRYHIPLVLTLVNTNVTPATEQKIAELSARLSEAGFIIVPEREAEYRVAQAGTTLDELLEKEQYRRIGELAQIDAVMNVREFYGTELHLMRVSDGKVIASGCWSLPAVEVVNRVIGQLKEGIPSPRLCPVPAR